jgi:hypothetical protein
MIGFTRVLHFCVQARHGRSFAIKSIIPLPPAIASPEKRWGKPGFSREQGALRWRIEAPGVIDKERQDGIIG